VRGDLVRILRGWQIRDLRLDRIVIETTGVADPLPVIRTLLLDRSLRQWLRLDGVIALADVKNAVQQIGEFIEARQQIAYADRIVLTKEDLAPTGAVKSVVDKLRQLNGVAPLWHAGEDGFVPRQAFDVGGFDHSRLLAASALPATGEDSGAHSELPIMSVGLELPGELNGPLVYRWLGDLLALEGSRIFRLKGIMAIAGAERRIVLEAIHDMIECREGRDWADSPRETRIALIGRGLGRERMEQGLRECLAEPSPNASAGQGLDLTHLSTGCEPRAET
jgi:G3E family GTPase